MKKLSLLVTLVLLGALSSGALAQSSDLPLDEPLQENTPVHTVAGNPFTAPVGWTMSVRGPATIMTAPEGGSHIALIDVEAKDAETAIEAGWRSYKEHDWPLKTVDDQADGNGWSRQKRFEYQTSPSEKRYVVAGAMFANDRWTVWIYDVANDVGGKRSSQVSLMFDTLLPNGYERESFAGKPARSLGAKEVAELTAFVERALEVSRVPGTSLGIIQDGEVVFSGGFGVRELGKPEQVDGDTLYMIASNTKGLSTLLLAKLVDEGKIDWKDKVVDVMPGFKLGDEDTTQQVLVEHLVCACTGLPRQDMEWLLEFGKFTPGSSMELLGKMQPTSEFGELFQYSNVMASAGGYVGGHVVHPEHDLGVAYDRAMQSRVFDPLAMADTTFDFDLAMGEANRASPHSVDVDGKPAIALMDINFGVIPVRPAGAGWSSVNDVLKYVAMELAAGKLPDGERYIGEAPLLERRRPQVSVSEDVYYGMGLFINDYYGVTVVHHGGDMIGYHSDMMWIPEHGVGAVILTNGDPGWLIRSGFRRKLLEVMFDGKPEADAQLKSRSEQFLSNVAVEYELLSMPADKAISEKLASRYRSRSLGDIVVTRDGDETIFDFGEWQSEVGSRKNPDGTISFVTTTTGIAGLGFHVGDDEARSLIMRDAQHEYVFEAM